MAFELTGYGEQEAAKIEGVNTPERAVVVYLYEMKRPVEFDEILGETRMSDEKALHVMRRLVNGGYVVEN